MSSEDLDDLISQLERIMPSDPGFFGIGVRRQDWRPFWSLAKEIQQCFNSGIRYPTKALRQAAWDRFNSLRSGGSKRADSERDHLRSRSEHHKDNLFRMCNGIGYSRITDVLFFFDPTTVSDMKARGGYLKEAMMYLKEHKDEMLGEHKKECYDRIQEIKDQHEDFWSQYREAKHARRDEIKQKIRGNIEKNRDKYRHAADALDRFRDKASDLRSKISSSTSDKWTDIWGGWLSETESKIDDIEAQLRRYDDWIEEDERRLRELE